jgi:Zinc carboxypeptidase.
MRVILPVFFPLLILLANFETWAQTPKELAEFWDAQHISKMPASQVRHKDLQNYLEELKKLGLKVEEVGRSYGSREIYQIEFGRGETRIFLWSQMHGDEPTATSALIDIFAFLQSNRDKNWVKLIEEKLTIRAVPMLNPDGAEYFQRRSLQSIDINRDARAQQTPEGRLLKKLRDEWSPHIGFNLHNQQSLTTVGRTTKQATISLLAVNGDPSGKVDEGQIRNRRIVSLMIEALNTLIPGHIARYDDSYNSRAFGDNFSGWGTPTILIETGDLYGRDEMFLIKLNFIAIMTAFKVIADGSEASAAIAVYENLPRNSSGRLFNVLFRKANVVDPSTGVSYMVDIGVNQERRRAGEEAPMYVREIGDIFSGAGLEEYNAIDFYVVARGGSLRVGAPAGFLFYKKTRRIDWRAKDLETEFPPDAVYIAGKWIKGEGVVPKMN